MADPVIVKIFGDGDILTMTDGATFGDGQFVRFAVIDHRFPGARFNRGTALRTPKGYTVNIDGSGPYYRDPVNVARKLMQLRKH